MVNIQAEKKRGYLRHICERAKASSATVGETLLARLNEVLSPNLQRGRLLQSTSGSGQSATFEKASEFTQDNILALIQEFLEVLRDTVAEGVPDVAEDAASIDTLYAAMCNHERLVGVRSMRGDWSMLNWSNTR